MRQSSQEKKLLLAENRLLHNDRHESLGMETAAFSLEAAQEWATGSASVKRSPRKTSR
ncbi:hypothetical protein [Paenibacillus koleovorans]|uniref:hypothetical protein n=1 Tax=Paenibacillus koleovorans TaxID=121608 RepID=UPI0013E2B62B|nr:hypothetical protein [Paenibacillus koleovorans]